MGGKITVDPFPLCGSGGTRDFLTFAGLIANCTARTQAKRTNLSCNARLQPSVLARYVPLPYDSSSKIEIKALVT